MATDKEYKAVIDALSGECERLHKVINNIRAEIEQALSQEPTEKPMTVDEIEREYEKSKALFQKIVECDDAISRNELLKAIDTWNKFGYTETGCFVREPKGDYVPYIHYDDVIKSIKGMPSVTQKPIECDDAVSREAVDKYIVELLSGYLYAEERERLEKLCAYLWDLPSVTRQTGEWIEDTKTYAGDHLSNYRCSLCGEIAGSWVQGLTQDKLFKFCPNCGADMRGTT